MYGIEQTSRALCRNAELISKCSRAWMVRCEPHPGHFNPVSSRNGHLGNQTDSAGLYVKYITLPMISPAMTHATYRIGLTERSLSKLT